MSTSAERLTTAMTKLERLRETERQLPAAIDRAQQAVAAILGELGFEVRPARGGKKRAAPKALSGGIAAPRPERGSLAAAKSVDDLPDLSRRIVALLPATRDWLMQCEELRDAAPQGKAAAITHLTRAGWITTDEETGQQLVLAPREEPSADDDEAA